MRPPESASSCNENLGERGRETVGETQEEGGRARPVVSLKWEQIDGRLFWKYRLVSAAILLSFVLPGRHLGGMSRACVCVCVCDFF